MAPSLTKTFPGLSLLLLAGAAADCPPEQARADTPPAVTSEWHLGGAGGWDYLTLDRSGARLFISRGTRVDVVDTANGRVIGSIPNTDGVHGIALAEDLHRGYTSNGKANTVTAFDLDTLQTLKVAPVSGVNPDAIVYDSASNQVFTFNGRSKNATVLDARTLGIVGTIPMPDKPEFAVSDGEGTVFVNIESESGQLLAIDTHTLKVKATWPLPGCATPSGLALDKVHHRLFSVCDGKVMAVTDAASGKQIAKVNIGEGPDAAAFDAQHGLVLSSNGDGTLTVIRQATPDRYPVAYSVPTQRGARTMAVDAAAGKVFLVSADFDAAPPATPEVPHPRAVPRPGTFTVLVVSLP